MHPGLVLVRHLLFPAACVSCRTDVPARRSAPICDPCELRIESAPRLPPPDGLDRLTASAVFDGPARDLVLGLKYARRAYLARFMGERLAAAAGPVDVDLIVPVPSPPLRRIQRGFNPADVLAFE